MVLLKWLKWVFYRLLDFALLAALYEIVNLACTPTFKVHNNGGILITGASTGIGRDAALALAAQGYTVYGTVRQESDGDAVVAMWRDAGMTCKSKGQDCERIEGGHLIPVLMDVTKPATIDAAHQKITADLRTRNIPFVGLVNNAGVAKGWPMEFVDMEEVRWVFEVNLFGVMEVQKKFLGLLRESEGRLVNIGSFAGIFAAPLGGVYSGTKFALEALTDATRRELQPHGVSVSIVEPAYVRTEISKKQTGENAPAQKLTEEEYEVYSMFLDQESATRVKMDSLADSTDCTTDAIVHALTNPAPKTRYVVANVGGTPAWILRKLLALIPDRAADLLGGKVRK